jgi:hypothetical protein
MAELSERIPLRHVLKCYCRCGSHVRVYLNTQHHHPRQSQRPAMVAAACQVLKLRTRDLHKGIID